MSRLHHRIGVVHGWWWRGWRGPGSQCVSHELHVGVGVGVHGRRGRQRPCEVRKLICVWCVEQRRERRVGRRKLIRHRCLVHRHCVGVFDQWRSGARRVGCRHVVGAVVRLVELVIVEIIIVVFVALVSAVLGRRQIGFVRTHKLHMFLCDGFVEYFLLHIGGGVGALGGVDARGGEGRDDGGLGEAVHPLALQRIHRQRHRVWERIVVVVCRHGCVCVHPSAAAHLVHLVVELQIDGQRGRQQTGSRNGCRCV
mmetsp:Transcript_49381/g.123819  ORF Transcript_49381/g.123819 Transcript_49381/m.123819 type:complete len:254 (-) Transcript_49381:406-1167(-)